MEVWGRVDEVIDDRLVEMKTAMIPWVPDESFQNLFETRSILVSIVASAQARSIERRHHDDLIGDNLTKIMVWRHYPRDNDQYPRELNFYLTSC